MTRIITRAAALVCMTGMALAGVPAMAQQQAAPGQQQAQEQGPNQVLKSKHGAWEIHCIEGTDSCAMQQVGSTADGKRALLVTVQRLANVTAEGNPVPAAITVNTPLGVLIPYGVRVSIDGGDVSPVPLMRCLPTSCTARAPLSDEGVDRLKRGSTAKFGLFLQEEILVDVSLNGFTAAYNELEPVEAMQN